MAELIKIPNKHLWIIGEKLKDEYFYMNHIIAISIETHLDDNWVVKVDVYQDS